MKRISKLYHMGVIQLALLVALLALLLSYAPRAFQATLAEVSVEAAEAPEQAVLVFKGSNMFRVNSFYVNGKRIGDSAVNKISYEECHVTVDQAVFAGDGEWRKVQLGHCKWGFINLLSTPLWIEWRGLDTPDVVLW